MISVVDYMEIRCGHYVGKKGVRELARETEHSRNTVKKYLKLDEPVPHYQRSVKRESPVLGPFKNIIEEMIAADIEKKPRERRTSHVIYNELMREHNFTGAESTVRRFFCAKRRELSGQYRAFAPLVHPASGEAQMDWVEDVEVILGGKECVVQVFALRFSHSSKIFLRAFHRMDMPAFLEGHVLAFTHFGGVAPVIWYDNLKCAVLDVLRGRKRVENETFKKFRGYYRFDARYCMVATPEEKGGVENLAGYIRRNFFVPKFSAENLEELNAKLLQMCLEEERRIPQRSCETIGEAFLREKESLLELPRYPYDCAKVEAVRADKYSCVHFERTRYSVPVAYALRRLTLRVYANRLVIACEEKVIAEWERCYKANCERLDPLHYLPLLKKKPNLLLYGKPFVGWNLPGVFERYRQRARFLYGNRGERHYIKILLQLENFSVNELAAALLRAEELGLTEPGSVATLLSLQGSKQGGAIKTAGFGEGGDIFSIRITQPLLNQYDEMMVYEEVAA